MWDWLFLSYFEFFWEEKGLIKWQSGLDFFEKTVFIIVKNIVLSLVQLSAENRPFKISNPFHQPLIFYSILGAQSFRIIYFFKSDLDILYILLYYILYIIVLIRLSLSICSWYGKLAVLCSRKSNEVANLDLKNLQNCMKKF